VRRAESDVKVDRPSRPRRARWIASVLVLLVLGLLLLPWVFRSRLEGWLRAALLQRLARTFDARVELGAFELDVTELAVQFRELAVSIPAGPARPLRFEALAGRVRLGWHGLLQLAGGRIHLQEVVLEQPRLESDREFWIERQKLRGPRPPPLSLQVDRLELRDGRVRYEDRESRFHVGTGTLALQARWDTGREALAGSAEAECVVQRPPLAQPLSLRVATRFRWDERALALQDLRASGSGLELEMEAELGWQEGLAITGRGQARADLDALRPLLDPALPVLSGKITGPFELRAGNEPLEVQATFAASQPRFGRIAADGATARVRYRAGHLALEQLDVAAFDGRLMGAATIRWPDPVHFEARLTAEDLRSDRVLPWLGLPSSVASRVDGELTLSGDPARVETLAGGARFVARREPGAAGIPARARGEWSIAHGMLELHAPDLELAAARVDLQLALGVDRRGRRGHIELAGETEDAEQTRQAAERILHEFGVDLPDFLDRPLSGHGTMRARLDLAERPRLALALQLAQGSWGGQPFERLALDLSTDGNDLELRDLRLTDGRESFVAAGKLRLAPFGVVELDARAQAIDPSWLAELLQLENVPTGLVTGNLEVRPTPEGSAGSGLIVLTGGSWLGEPIDELRAEVRLEGEGVRIPRFELHGPSVEGEGSALWDGRAAALQLEIERAQLRLGQLAPVRARALAVEGALSVAGTLRLDRSGPHGTLQLSSESSRLQGHAVGGATGQLVLEPGRLRLDLASTEAASWSLAGSADLTGEYPASGVIELREASFAVPVGRSTDGRVVLSGRLEVQGPLQRPEAMRIEGTLSAAQLELAGTQLAATAPIDVRFVEQVLSIESMQFAGPNSNLEARLRYDLARDDLQVDAAGTLDLGLLAAPFAAVRASGPVRVELAARGPAGHPQLQGSLSATSARLRWLGFPQPLEQVAFRVALSGRQAELSELTARLGHGELRASGTATVSGLALEGFGAEIEASNVRLEYPEGLRGVYEGRLELKGNAEQATLAGRLFMLRGLYDEPFGLAQLMGLGAREYEPATGPNLVDNLYLDLELEGGGNFWVRNELAEIESRFQLHLGGTLSRPEITGRVFMLQGGKILFRDVEYQILYGSLDFIDLDRLNPYLTLRAQTTVRDYTIVLRIEGTLEQFDYELTSDPPLSTQDIIVLLTTGSTLEELNEAGAGTENPYTGDVAASYFAGALTGRFERQLQRKLGLERVRINPLLIQGQADPTTRITLGKRLTDKLFFVFSNDLGHAERQIYQMEWQARTNLRLTAEQDTLGGVSGNVQYTDRFWWREPRYRREEAVPTPETAPAAPAGAQRVRTILVRGVDEARAAELAAGLGLAAGDPFTRSAMFAGAEQLRRHYVKAGHIEASVDVAASVPADGVELVYTVAPGPRVTVTFSGVSGKEEKQLRRELETLWAESLFTEDLYEDSAIAIRDLFHERGFYAADVQHEQQPQPDGTKLVQFIVDRGKPVRVEAIRIEGAHEVGEERIRRQMLTRPSSLFARNTVVPRVLDEDVAAIRSLYRDLGYLQVSIARPRVLLSADGDSAEIVVGVDEGPQFIVEAVSLAGELPFPEEQMRVWAGLAAGEVFSPARLFQAEEALRRQIDARGYPEARVRAEVELADSRVRVRFQVQPGEQMQLGEIDITGNQLTRDKIILRELQIHPGAPISREKLLQSQHRLYQLGLFRNVRLQYTPMPDRDPGWQRLQIEVEEIEPITSSIGAGYDSEVGLRASFSLANENLGGYDRVVGLQGRISQRDQRLQLIVKEPRLFTRALPALLNFSWEEREEETFSLQQRVAALRVDKRFNPKWSGYARYGFQRVDVLEVLDVEDLQQEKLEDVTLGDVGLTLVRDTRDDPFRPTRGTQLTLSNRLFAEALLSERQFVKSTFGFAVVHGLNEGVSVASGVRVGVAPTFGDTQQVPLSEAFFAGGDASLRGFRRGEVGEPVGGEGLFLLNEELRFKIWGQLRGVVFYDAGNVYEQLSDFDVTNVRNVLGAGIRLETPIGPLRVEYGHKLDRQPGESAGELFFAVGNAF
jgi:outer membrane protein insertion porin family